MAIQYQVDVSATMVEKVWNLLDKAMMVHTASVVHRIGLPPLELVRQGPTACNQDPRITLPTLAFTAGSTAQEGTCLLFLEEWFTNCQIRLDYSADCDAVLRPRLSISGWLIVASDPVLDWFRFILEELGDEVDGAFINCSFTQVEQGPYLSRVPYNPEIASTLRRIIEHNRELAVTARIAMARLPEEW